MPETEENEKCPLWNSCRLTFAICSCIGFFFQVVLRLNLSFTLICMVKKPLFTPLSANRTSEELECMNNTERSEQMFLQEEFHWTKSHEGILMSGYFYGSTIGHPLGGILTKFFFSKNLFITGILGQGICTILFPFASRWDFYASVCLRSVQGFLSGLVVPSAYDLLTAWAHPDERATMLSMGNSGTPIGLILIFPLASLLCQVRIDRGWPMVFYITGCFATMFSISLFWLIYETADKHPRISPREHAFLTKIRDSNKKSPKLQFSKMFSSVPIWTCFVVHFCQSWGLTFLGLLIPQVMQQVLFFNIKWNGIYSATPFIGCLVARILLSLTYDRLFQASGLSLTVYRKIFHVFGTFLPALCIFIITLLTCKQGVLIVVLFGFFGASQDLSFIGSYWGSYLDLAPAFAGTLTGFSNTLSNITGIFSPLIISAIVVGGTKSEWNTVFYIMISFYMFSGIIYVLFGSSKPLPWGQFVTAEQDQQQVREQDENNEHDNTLESAAT